MIGGGFGGSAIAIVKDEAENLSKILEKFIVMQLGTMQVSMMRKL